MRPHARGLGFRIAKRRRLAFEVVALHQLHLDGVDAVFRATVVTRRPAALEAAVDDMGEASGAGADIARGRGNLRIAGATVIVADVEVRQPPFEQRSEEHTSELQSLMRISYAVFCLKK